MMVKMCQGERKSQPRPKKPGHRGDRKRPVGAATAGVARQLVQRVDTDCLHGRSACRSDWQATAGAWAKEAWERDCGRRIGLYLVHADDERDQGYLVIYNNHPQEGFPLLREQELLEIRKRLNAAGVEELAYATYPHTREGFTYAVVLGVGAGWETMVEALVNDATDVCWSRRS